MNSRSPDWGPLPRGPDRRTAPPDPEGIDLGALLGSLLRNKWLILGFMLIAMGVAFVALRNTRPSFVSYVEVLLDTRQERVVGVEQVVSDLDVTNSVVAGEIAVLRSNLLLGRVVDDLGLMEKPEFDPYAAARPGRIARLATMIRSRLADIGLAGEVPEPMPEPSGDIRDGLSREDARNLVIWQVRRNLAVSQSGISYVISISMRAHEPAIAAAIANAVAEQYIGDQLATKLAATQRAIDWLDRRLIDLEGQLRAAEDEVVEFLAQQVLEEGGDKESVSQQLAEMNRSIVTARDERATASVRLAHVRGLMADRDVEGAAAALGTARLVGLDTELADLGRRRARLSTRLGPRHPEMLALELALGDLSRDRTLAIRAGLGEMEAMLVQAEGRESAIREAIGRAQLQQVELSRASVRLSQLERSASAMRQVYESFLARFQETTQQLEFQRPDARIITKGVPALAPSRPRGKLIMAVALVLGATLGVVAALLRAALDRTVRTPSDLTRATWLPVLSTLPRQPVRDRKARWQVAELRRSDISAYAEGLRMLRFGLMNPQTGTPPRTVMLTGAEWGAGSSTAVLGLGRAVAALGHRVVILDANFRNPQQCGLLGLKPAYPGVADFIDGRATQAEVTLSEVEPGLSLVPASRAEGKGADMLSSPRFRTLIDDLAAAYDMVIVDAPPATGLADTTVLAGLTDAIVIVVRSGVSRVDSVASAAAALGNAGGRVVGAVLSHARGPVASSPAAPRTGPVFEMEH